MAMAWVLMGGIGQNRQLLFDFIELMDKVNSPQTIMEKENCL